MAVLKVQKREGTGKYVAFNLRKEGKIPAVMYGKNADNVNLTVDEKELSILVKQGVRLLDLDIEGTTQRAILKAAQHENIGEKITHADFRIVDENTVLHIDIEVETTGEAVGIDAGGVVELDLHRVGIACLPKDIVESVTVDVSSLNIGKVLYVRDLPELTGVKYTTPADVAVVSCHGKGAEEDEEGEESSEESSEE